MLEVSDHWRNSIHSERCLYYNEIDPRSSSALTSINTNQIIQQRVTDDQAARSLQTLFNNMTTPPELTPKKQTTNQPNRSSVEKTGSQLTLFEVEDGLDESDAPRRPKLMSRSVSILNERDLGKIRTVGGWLDEIHLEKDNDSFILRDRSQRLKIQCPEAFYSEPLNKFYPKYFRALPYLHTSLKKQNQKLLVTAVVHINHFKNGYFTSSLLQGWYMNWDGRPISEIGKRYWKYNK